MFYHISLIVSCCFGLRGSVNGDYQEALEIHEKLVPLYLALSHDPKPSGIKYAVSLLGLCSEEVRLPMLPPDDHVKEGIRKALSFWV